MLKLVQDVAHGKQEADILKRLQGRTRHVPRFLTSGLFACGQEWYHGVVLGFIGTLLLLCFPARMQC